MTVGDVMMRFDEIRPQYRPTTDNAIDIVTRYVLRLENMVRREVQGEKEEIYAAGFDLATELSVPEPYSEIYVLYALAMSEFYSGDYTRYNNTIERFDELFEKYKAYYIRNNKPGSSEVKVW